MRINTHSCLGPNHLRNEWKWYLGISSHSYLYPCCWDHITHLTASGKSIRYGQVQKECSLKRRRQHFWDSCGVDPKWGSQAGGSLSIVRQIDLLRGGMERKRCNKIYATVYSQRGTISKNRNERAYGQSNELLTSAGKKLAVLTQYVLVCSQPFCQLCCWGSWALLPGVFNCLKSILS